MFRISPTVSVLCFLIVSSYTAEIKAQDCVKITIRKSCEDVFGEQKNSPCTGCTSMNDTCDTDEFKIANASWVPLTWAAKKPTGIETGSDWDLPTETQDRICGEEGECYEPCERGMQGPSEYFYCGANVGADVKITYFVFLAACSGGPM